MTLVGAGPILQLKATLAILVTVVGGLLGHLAERPGLTASGTPGPAAVSRGSTGTAGSALPIADASTLRNLPLAGKVVGIDPGHNGANFRDPGFIDAPIFNGRETESCDTTGTETDAGYTEAQFNFNVASDLRADLERMGARVVMTRSSNTGVGPCVTTRAAILNRAHTNVAIDIHADGGPVGGRGFTILTPVADGPNDRIIAASGRFARLLRDDFSHGTGMPESTYDGIDGLEPRDDLAGLNLATEPKVLIECGNMRNATDARLLVSAAWQRRAAAAMAAAIAAFLR